MKISAVLLAAYKTSTPGERLFIILVVVMAWFALPSRAQPTYEINVETIEFHTHLFGPPPPDWIGSPASWGIMPDASGVTVEECPECKSVHNEHSLNTD